MKKSFKTILALCAAAVLSLSCTFAVAACGEDPDHYDAITKTLKLTKSFEGKVLESADGIEEVTLPGSTTDGDTTTFKLSEAGGGGYVRVRYQGVNTPESTGAVEKWGKAASIFTDTQLKSATRIVLESARDGAPEKDTVGGRSLCYVWYQTEGEDFKCLNLELVENGYSINKENADNAYYSKFQEAEAFAKEKKLHLHDPNLVDPLFDTSVQSISLKEFSEHPENYAENMKVHLHAYVVEKLSKSGITYTIAQYDEDTGKVYKLTVYAGHVSGDGRLRVGGLYHIVGTLQKYDDNWQIGGIGYDNDYKGKEDSEHSWQVQSSYYLTFNTSDPYYNSEYGTANTYGKVTVGTVTRNGSSLTFTGSAKNKEDDTNTFTFTVKVPDDYVEGTISAGKQITVMGCYRFTDGSDELTIVNYTDIVL